MRLKITLVSEQQTIPINYQHFLSSAIYDYLSKSDIKFSTNLHDSKNFKFFTFSWLQFPQKKIIDFMIKIISPEFYWYISSPWDEFIQNFVNGLLELGGLRIGQYNFPITQTETLPNLIATHEWFFGEKQSQLCRHSSPLSKGGINSNRNSFRFSCLSPLVVTTKKEYKGKLVKYYYKPTDNPEEISEKIRQNLINKYSAFYSLTTKQLDNQTTRQLNNQTTELKIEFDKNYIKTPKARVLSHYIKDDLDIKIPAIMCPFTATGSVELIKFGYECGFGELNSAGFGMVKLI